jgi:hypothetical protein
MTASTEALVLELPFHSEDMNINRVRSAGFVLYAHEWNQCGKLEESFGAEDIGEFVEHCARFLAANKRNHRCWELRISVYGDSQVPTDFPDRVAARVAEAEPWTG